MDRGDAELAEILHDGVALDANARRASSIEVDPIIVAAVEERFDSARSSLSALCGVTLSGREGAGFIRYSDGGFYGPHRDQGHDPQWPSAARRRIAVVVFLNSGGFIGGERMIYTEPRADNLRDTLEITPREGLLVAFDAARLHEVRPVSGGIRDVIVDWFY